MSAEFQRQQDFAQSRMDFVKNYMRRYMNILSEAMTDERLIADILASIEDINPGQSAPLPADLNHTPHSPHCKSIS